MAFESVLGQERPKDLMRAVLTRERLAHTYLFTGPDGVGKTLFAKELARVLLCSCRGEKPAAKCSPCSMILHNNHPDLLLIEVEEEKREIGIALARDVLIPFLSLKPVQSERRVAIVREAERMSEEMANALLKTFEEPPLFATIVLTTSNPRALLPTIRSRCQELRFEPLLPGQVEGILSTNAQWPPDQVKVAARLGDGSARTAQEILESGSLEIYGQVLRRTLALPSEDFLSISSEVSAWAGGASKKLEPQRDRLREMLRLLGTAYRDVLMVRLGTETDRLLNSPQPVQAAATRLTTDRILRIQDALYTARRQIDCNAAAGLVLDDLFGRIEELQLCQR